VALAAANDQAADVYSKSMDEAKAAAEKMRQRMLEAARQKADKQLQETLSEAKKKADAEAAARLAEAKAAAEAEKKKDLAAANRKIESAAARLVTSAEEQAQRKYEAALAKAKEDAAKTRQRLLAEATREAEAARAKQIASVGPDSKPSGTVPAAPSDAELGLGKDVPAALRERIDAAMSAARKKGQGRAGEMRAALQAIKAYREEETKRAKAGQPPPKSDAPMALDFAAATPELKEIIEIAMKRARSEGKSYQGQVQAALNAVKVYRERESTEEKSPEKDSSQTSALLLGKAQADPELRRVIMSAMAQARARGEDYPAQVRAALAAIKAHRARTAGKQAK
jgi:hypothetical protein